MEHGNSRHVNDGEVLRISRDIVHQRVNSNTSDHRFFQLIDWVGGGENEEVLVVRIIIKRRVYSAVDGSSFSKREVHQSSMVHG